MKKLIITFLLCGWALNLYALPPFFSYGGGGTISGEVNVSDDAYNATTWDNDGLNAPSRNAVRDKFESLDGDYQPLDTNLTDLATGSPTGTYDLSGATINFGLEDADIPASIARVNELPTATSLHLDDVLTALGIASEDVHFGEFAGTTIDDNLTAKAIFQALESAIEGLESAGISDLDNLPGDTIDNNLIDKAIVQDSGNWDTAYGWGNHASAGYAASNHNHDLVYALIDHTHDYSAVFAALDHTHALLYQPLDTDLTALAGISGQRGDVLYYGASGWTRLGKGTPGYVLTQGENDPVWAAATGGSFSGDASDVDYDNTESALEATDVQGAIDEVVGMIGAIEVGEVNLASPGPIGGTTPDTGTFTTLTADSLNITRKSGSATIAEFYEDPDNGDNKVTVTVPASMDSDTTFNLVEVYNSMTTLRDAIGEGSPGSGLPEGGTAGQILVKTESGAEWQDFEDHPAYTTLLNAFLAAGLNTFTFTPYTPASYPYYSATGTFNLDFEVTDTSTSYTIAGVRYQLDEGGYDGNSASDQGSNIWRVALVDLTEDTYTLQLEATDNKGTPNTGESSEFTVVVDLTDPVVTLEAVLDPANPTTHDGTGTGTFVLDWDEMVTETNPASARYRVDNGATTGDWISWASPWADVEIDLPETEEDVTITLEVTDLAGRVGTDGVTVAYSAPAGVEDEFDVIGATYYAVAPSGYTYSATQDTYYSTRKYTTLSAAEAALPASPSAPQVINILGTWSSPDTTEVIIDGTTTTVDNYILIRTVASSGSRHQGVYNASSYYAIQRANGNGIVVRDDNVRLVGLQIGTSTTSGTYRSVYIDSPVTGLLIDRCILKLISSSGGNPFGIKFGSSSDGSSATIRNSVIEGAYINAIYEDYSGSSAINVYNCTISGSGVGIARLQSTLTVTNCAIFNNTDDLNGTIDITYSAIDDADEFTGKVSLNENASGEWTAAFTDYSNGVYSVKDTSSPLRNAGVSIPGITEDIIGVSRPKSTANDIGAFEFNE